LQSLSVADNRSWFTKLHDYIVNKGDRLASDLGFRKNAKQINGDKLGSKTVYSSCGVRLDPTGQFLALSDDQTLKIWNLGSRGPALYTTQKDGQAPVPGALFPGVDCVRFSPDNERPVLLASSYSYNPARSTRDHSQIRMWEFSAEKRTFIESNEPAIGVSAPIVNITFVKNSSEVVVLTSDEIQLYDAPDYKLSPKSKTISSPPYGPVQAGFFNTDGTYLVVSYRSGHAEIYDLLAEKLSPKELKFTDHDDDFLQSVAFSSDSSRIATGTNFGCVGIQGNPLNSATPATSSHTDPTPKTTREQASKAFPYCNVAGMDRSISALAVYAIGTEELIAAGTVHGDAAVFHHSPAGETQREQIPGLRILSPGYAAQHFTHFGTVTAVSFAGLGRELVTASDDQKARVFDVNSGMEIARIAHSARVVSAIKIEKGEAQNRVVSVSQDADVEITDFSERTVLRTVATGPFCRSEALYANSQSVWPSVVSAQSWTWACDGKMSELNDGKLSSEPDEWSYGESLPWSMRFNRDGSTAMWMDNKFGIHYAKRIDKNKWKTNKSPWKPGPDTRYREDPQLLPSSANLPLLALSPSGNFVAISFSVTNVRQTRNVIEVLKVRDDPGDIELTQLRNLLSPTREKGSATELLPYGIDAGDEGSGSQLLSIAVDDQGSIIAGTANNTILHYVRGANEWTKEPILLPDDKKLGLQERVIQAVAFVGDGGRNILASRGDRSIWLFTWLDRTKQYQPHGIPPEDYTPAEKFVFSEDGSQVAAIDKASVTFFTLNDNQLTKSLILQEPGPIQSISINKDHTVLTSVVIQDSLVRIKHNLDSEKHVQWICDKQPQGQDPNSVEEKGCKDLRGSRPWRRNSCFWDNSGKPCSKADN
jgi:WD40 repeat protein